MSLFLSCYISFQTRADLALVKFCYNAAVRRFLKTFRKFAGKQLLWKPFLGKFKLDSGNVVGLRKWTQVMSSFYQFFKQFLGNIEKKRIPLK